MTEASGKAHAVFLDRDGVLNKVKLVDGRPHPPATLQELKILSDAEAALFRLKAERFLLVVVTNQPDIARGLADMSAVAAMNDFLRRTLQIDRVMICPHDDEAKCSCRKPKPGMLLQAAEELGIELTKSFMVGDRWRDIEAGNLAGCRTVLIGDGYGETFVSSPTVRVASLSDAASWIIEQNLQSG